MTGVKIDLATYPVREEAQFVLNEIFNQIAYHQEVSVYQLPTVAEVRKRMSKE